MVQADEAGEERRFSVTVSAELLALIEERRQAAGLSRTAWVAQALQQACTCEPGANQNEPPRTTAEPNANQGDASTGALIVQAQISSLNREIANRDQIIERQDREIEYYRGEVSKVIDRAALGQTPPAGLEEERPGGFFAGLRSWFRRT